MVEVARLELTASRSQIWRSSQLSYTSIGRTGEGKNRGYDKLTCLKGLKTRERSGGINMWVAPFPAILE